MKISFFAATLAVTTLCFDHAALCRDHQPPAAFSDSVLSEIPSASQLLEDIVQMMGIQQNFELKEAKVANIQATVSRRKRYILYNPDYISWINNVTQDKWAATALLAHEIGHHLNGHTLKRSGSKPKLELEADEFAGFVMQRMGASLEQSQEVMLYIASTKGSRTHPARNLRMLAIRKGWTKAMAETTVTAGK